MTEIDYSRILAGFFLAYAIMYAGSGYIVDRLGTKTKLFAVHRGLVVRVGRCMRFATGVWSFGIARFMLGLGEPGNWPAATKAVSEWFAPRQRALGVGIFNAGSSVGSALAPPVVSWLTIAYGWQFAFIAVGAARLRLADALVAALRFPASQPFAAPRANISNSKTKFCLQQRHGPPPAKAVDWRRVVRTRRSQGALYCARRSPIPSSTSSSSGCPPIW